MTGVSVVIPHYGSTVPTLELVRMLRQQKTHLPLQVIVSDDGSAVPFPPEQGVDVVHRPRNGGFGSAVNSGAALAKYPNLLVLNSDITVQDTFIDELVASAAPWMPAVVSPRVTTPDDHQTWTGRHFPLVRHQFVEWLIPLARVRDRPVLHEAVGHDTRAANGVTAVADWVVGAVLLMPTSEFRAVGGFDERFFMNSEEVDLQRRLRQRGLPSVVLGAPTVVHEGGGSSGDTARRRAWLVGSRLEYAGKWGARRRLAAALVLATGINFVWNACRRALGRRVRPVVTARQELALLGIGEGR